MIGRRVIVNLIVFLLSTGGLVALGVTQLLIKDTGGPVVTVDFTDSGGLAVRNDVTMRGVNVGAVSDVELTETGVVAEITLDRGTEVPAGSFFQVTRRSPIGDLVVDIEPGAGSPLRDGAHVYSSFSAPPPDAGKTVEVLAEVLGSVPAEDLSIVVSELATALRGRGDDLARLSEVSADLPEKILTVKSELESLILTGPQVTGVLADNADVLADDLTRTAHLVDILRDNRFELVDLYAQGGRFTDVAGRLLSEEKANIACLIEDFGHINTVMGESQNLSNLAKALQLNPLFFGAVDLAVRTGLDDRAWFRVQLLPHQEPAGRTYAGHRPAPDVKLGNACTSRFGDGVDATTRSDGNVKLAPGSKVSNGS